jgi:hypothetical protein
LEIAQIFGRAWQWRSLGALIETVTNAQVTVIQPTPVRPEPNPAPKTHELDWDPLTPDWWHSLPGNPHAPSRRRTQQQRVLYERIKFVADLGNASWYAGRHLASPRYYVADFGNVAVAECVDEGNAVYLVHATNSLGWRSVFRASKREALERGARRIEHRPGWQDKLRQVVAGQRRRLEHETRPA